ncbi:MAG: alpha/beta hydrolase family protein [Actinomycetota bacterium]
METRGFELDSSGVVLKGKVLLPTARRPVPLVVLCHGIPSGEPALPGDPGYEALAERFLARGVGACIFNFRGTGESGGDFSLPGWVEDLTKILEETTSGRNAFEGCDPDRVSLMGFSGGGAVSIVCAARWPGLRALVSVSSPADFAHLITREGIGDFIAHARRIGIIRDPAYPASEEEYYEGIHSCRPVEVVSRVSPTPLLIVHGAKDETVPLSEARLLYEAAKEPKELYVVPGGGHKLRHHAEAMERATSWLLKRL